MLSKLIASNVDEPHEPKLQIFQTLTSNSASVLLHPVNTLWPL